MDCSKFVISNIDYFGGLKKIDCLGTRENKKKESLCKAPYLHRP